MNINTSTPPVNMRTFEATSLKRTLEDNGTIVIPGSKILLVEKAPHESCLFAEADMTSSQDLTRTVTHLFQATVRDQQNEFKFGTLGMFGFGISPEAGRFGIVSNEPIHLSSKDDITFKINAVDIAKKMILAQIPNPLVIDKGQSMWIEDINFVPTNCQHGYATQEAKIEFERQMSNKFTIAGASLPPDIVERITQNRTLTPMVSYSDVPLRITRKDNGILLTPSERFEMKFYTIPLPRLEFSFVLFPNRN